jgi:hypothetical protein
MQNTNQATRNPFGVQDVPNPQDGEVLEFARQAQPLGSADDANSESWGDASSEGSPSLEGEWSSRWNGGAAGNQWKAGGGTIRMIGDRFYALFDWDGGMQRGLIEARREGATLIGRYINLGKPEITRPWVGTIVNAQRIDGQWTLGRLDFRRCSGSYFS